MYEHDASHLGIPAHTLYGTKEFEAKRGKRAARSKHAPRRAEDTVEACQHQDRASLLAHYSNVRRRLYTPKRHLHPVEIEAKQPADANAPALPKFWFIDCADEPPMEIEREVEAAIDMERDWLIIEPRVSIASIVHATCAHFSMRKIDLLSQRRTADVARARQIAAYIARKYTTCSLPLIGKRMGGRDHTTILHAFQKIGDLVEASDEKTVADVEAIKLLVGLGAAE